MQPPATPSPQKLTKINDSLPQWFGYKVGEVGLTGIKIKKKK
jgi:hypothetical protein